MAYVFGRWDLASPACTTAPDVPSDEVFRRIANGDRLAMRTLFVRYRVSLYRWLLRSVGDAALAEKLLIDVFLDVWRNAASFDGRSSVSTWLLAIAKTRALTSKPDAELAATVPAASDELELPLQGSREEVLRYSLARLSREYGEVIDLVYYHGRSVKEVAQIVGTDKQTVNTRMYDARRRLAEFVELRTYALGLKKCVLPHLGSAAYYWTLGGRGVSCELAATDFKARALKGASETAP
jgi:RNA polymerase sigma-70 factor (ECF subfamily)